MKETKEMLILIEKINGILNLKNLSRSKLSEMLNCSDSNLSQMISGKRPFSEKIKEQLLPILEVPREEFDSWVIADKYSKEIIELAIKAKQEKSRVCHPALTDGVIESNARNLQPGLRDAKHRRVDAGSNKQTKSTNQSGINTNGKIPDQVRNDKGILILTIKIDAILEEKEISRTALAKQIKYSQSAINQMIVGKRNISKSVLEKMSEILEASQDEILSWTLADSYSLDTLEMACAHK